VGRTSFAPWPVALYGVVLLLAGFAYFGLTCALLAADGAGSVLATALGRDWKARASLAIYLVAAPLAFLSSWLAFGLYVVVALMWLVPDRRIERTLVG